MPEGALSLACCISAGNRPEADASRRGVAAAAARLARTAGRRAEANIARRADLVSHVAYYGVLLLSKSHNLQVRAIIELRPSQPKQGGGGGVSRICETHMSNPNFRVRIVLYSSDAADMSCLWLLSFRLALMGPFAVRLDE